jgi:hypothetical protein
MRKFIAAGVIAGAALLATPAIAGAEGNAYGATARACVAELGAPNLGQGIQDGKLAHPGAKMTAKTIAESIHCAD